MKISIILSIIVILSIIIFVHFRTYNTVSQNVISQQFVIEDDDDIITVGRNLARENLIASRWYFYYYAWKNKLRGTIYAGNYMVESHVQLADIVYKITKGDAIVQKEKDIKITFPEGWTFETMAERLNKNSLPGDEFAQIAKNPPQELYTQYSFLNKDASLEGYLFPDTYFFLADATAQDIIDRMLDNFDVKVDQTQRDIIEQNGDNLYDILIFASVIEGEVAVANDRQIVAGIFKNRLDIGMALQSDATIDYIKGMPEIKHTQADIDIDSLYNTYKYPGLPPGPINNPSLESIHAAISPQETDYMYFLNNAETGETVFSRTFETHIANKKANGL